MSGFLNDIWRDVIAVTGIALAFWQAWGNIRVLARRALGHRVNRPQPKAGQSVRPSSDQITESDATAYKKLVLSLIIATACISLVLSSLPEWAAVLLLMIGIVAAFVETTVAYILVGDWLERTQPELSSRVGRYLLFGQYALPFIITGLAIAILHGIEKPLQWWSGFVIMQIGGCAVLMGSAALGMTIFGVGSGVAYIATRIAGFWRRHA